MFVFDPYSPQVDADPFPFYKTLRDEYPCYWSEPAGMWVLSRYADVVDALNDWETYSSAQGNMMTELPGRAVENEPALVALRIHALDARHPRGIVLAPAREDTGFTEKT